MKAQLNAIEERVHGFRGKEKASGEPAFDRKKMKAMEDVKLKVLEMSRRNKELELEKRELALKLNSSQAKTRSLSTVTESEVIAGVKEEASALRRGNEDLLKQIETLQKQRFGMVEELVYQKWLNSCLRFEVQDYRTPPRTPGRDPSEDRSSGSQKDLAESPGQEIRSRRMRVSFNDRVSVRNLEPEFEDTLPTGETEPFGWEIYDRSSSWMPSRELMDGATSVVQQDKAKNHRDVTASEATS